MNKIKDFVAIVNHSNCEIDLTSGKTKFLDAKSILGIMSCNISEPLTINIIGTAKIQEELIVELFLTVEDTLYKLV